MRSINRNELKKDREEVKKGDLDQVRIDVYAEVKMEDREEVKIDDPEEMKTNVQGEVRIEDPDVAKNVALEIHW